MEELAALPDGDTPQPPALTDVVEQFGDRWQIHAAEFCFVAVRRPTPTCQEIVPATDPARLAVKLAAEEAVSK